LESRDFDRLARLISSGHSRRRVIKALAGGALGTLSAEVGLRGAGSARAPSATPVNSMRTAPRAFAFRRAAPARSAAAPARSIVLREISVTRRSAPTAHAPIRPRPANRAPAMNSASRTQCVRPMAPAPASRWFARRPTSVMGRERAIRKPGHAVPIRFWREPASSPVFATPAAKSTRRTIARLAIRRRARPIGLIDRNKHRATAEPASVTRTAFVRHRSARTRPSARPAMTAARVTSAATGSASRHARTISNAARTAGHATATIRIRTRPPSA
jgi:hypothetical protein